MKRKYGKIAAALAGAVLLAGGMSTTVFAESGWKEESGGWVYLDQYGEYVTDTWKKSGSQFYYLDESGRMLVDTFVEHNGHLYCVDENGVQLRNAWVCVPDAEEARNIWYYFSVAGKAYTGGKKTIGGKKYIFDEEGHMLTGWQQYGDREEWYYLGTEDEGWARTGWQCLEPDEDMDGDYDSEAWFFFRTSTGAAYRDGRKHINGHYYTFDENGAMQDSWLIGTPAAPDYSGVGGASQSNAYYREDGSQGKGWVYIWAPDDVDENGDQGWYYLDKNGVPFNQNGKDAHQETNYGKVMKWDGKHWDVGNMLDGVAARVIDGETYIFDNSGRMLTGLYFLNQIACTGSSGDLGAIPNITPDGYRYYTGAPYYFCEKEGPKEGRMLTGKQAIEVDGELIHLYFRKDGRAYVNTIADGVLYGPDGVRVEAGDGYRMVRISENSAVYEKGTNKEHVDCFMFVNKNGRVKKSGTVKYKGVKYTIRDYEVVEEEEI